MVTPSMSFRLPVRRYVQNTAKIETPQNRFGTLQWVLARPLYRFNIFDLAQVPSKSRAQALRLELAQWTPFASSDYFVGWHGQQALVWAWDTDKVKLAIAAQGLKAPRVQILPETVLQSPFQGGLCLSRCHEGCEGQLWRDGQLAHSRWWPQTPSPDEWLMFQRDAGIPPTEQQNQPPAPRINPLMASPWVNPQGSPDNQTAQRERLAYALSAVVLMVPTFWYAFNLYQVQLSTAHLREQQAQLQQDVAPITLARSQALDHLARINALRALAPYPEQLTLMGSIAQVLPQDKSYIKDWDFQSGQLKLTLTSSADISTTNLIGLLQQAGPFRDVKALPGRDPKSITFQMDVNGS